MIYNNTLNYSFVNVDVFNATGAERLYLIESGQVTGFSTDNDQITELPTETLFNLFDNLDELSYSVKTDTSKAGTVYLVEINFKITGIRTAVNSVLEKLLSNDLTAILGDSNGRFWLLGFGQGLKSQFEYSSEDAGYTVKLSTRQLTKPEEVAFELIKSLEVNEDYEDNSVTPVYVTPIPSQGTSGGSGSGNVFNTITVNSNNYQLDNNDHFVLVTGAYTVKLPLSPVDGQQHILKATYDASVSPVIISGDEELIDGSVTAVINTNAGSMSLIYESGNWYTVAFMV